MLKKKTGPIPPPPLSKEGLMVWKGGGDLTLWDQNLVLKLQFKK